MGGLWRRLGQLLPRREDKPRPVSAQEKFACLRAIGAANDAFLSALARHQELLESGLPLRVGVVAQAYEALSTPVGAMVGALMTMGEGRHHELPQRYETLARELAQEVLRARPMEVGPLVVWPGDAVASQAGVVGPKAARLAQLATKPEFDVPPFFSVTVHGFRLFMEATGVQDLVQDSLASAELHRDAELRRFSDRVTAAILAAPLPAELQRAILDALRTIHERMGRKASVAVRSSAVVEDAESSFAGQFESVLNVREDEVSAAYRRVIASKYRPEGLRYALARGFLDEDVAMPVLVMAMVEPEAAGVAYSRSPENPACALITAVPGLAQTIVDGRVVPDHFVVADGEPPRVEEETHGRWEIILRCAPEGGLEETSEGPSRGRGTLDHVTAGRVARLSWSLSRIFGGPQDVEWALDHSGALWVVQTRPLNLPGVGEGPPERGRSVVGYRVLLRGGNRASGGVAAGRVVKRDDPAAVGELPEHCILVVPSTSPRLAGAMGQVAGLVTGTGSATGHMATVAREFGVPCLVGAARAMTSLSEGQLVTLDADAQAVYEGEVLELLAEPARRTAVTRRDPVRESLQRLVDRVTPLTLTDPDAPAFAAEHCRTLHDVARFVHQRAMAEMFAIEGPSPRERRGCRRLAWPHPMEILVLDLGGGIAPSASRHLRPEDVASVPLQALLEGMMDSRLRWAGPVGFDLRGFMSVVVRSAADDQRYGEPSYALCSHDYVHFASRLAYHFATVDAICGSSVNENYVRFRFFGGAAVAQRREWRGCFLATVLHYNRFAVTQVGDRVDATLAKRTAGELEDALVMLGRLMVASRHLDMVIESPAVASALAQAFLGGDYGFEQVRRGNVP